MAQPQIRTQVATIIRDNQIPAHQASVLWALVIKAEKGAHD